VTTGNVHEVLQVWNATGASSIAAAAGHHERKVSGYEREHESLEVPKYSILHFVRLGQCSAVFTKSRVCMSQTGTRISMHAPKLHAPLAGSLTSQHNMLFAAGAACNHMLRPNTIVQMIAS